MLRNKPSIISIHISCTLQMTKLVTLSNKDCESGINTDRNRTFSKACIANYRVLVMK